MTALEESPNWPLTDDAVVSTGPDELHEQHEETPRRLQGDLTLGAPIAKPPTAFTTSYAAALSRVEDRAPSKKPPSPGEKPLNPAPGEITPPSTPPGQASSRPLSPVSDIKTRSLSPIGMAALENIATMLPRPTMSHSSSSTSDLLTLPHAFATSFPNRSQQTLSTVVTAPEYAPSTTSSATGEPWQVTQSKHSKNKSSKTKFPSLSTMFQFQGSSAPMSLGFTPSPKKEHLPEDSPFHPATKANRPLLSPSHSPTRRPINHRRSSTLQAAASFLGLGTPPRTPRSGSVSPTRKSPSVIVPQSLFMEDVDFDEDEEDPIMNIELMSELLPHGLPNPDPSDVADGTKSYSHAFDDLLANSQRLFLHMRMAYATKRQTLRETKMDVADRETEHEEEMDELQTRERHWKMQLDEMANRMADKDDEVKKLACEMEGEKQKRERERTLKVRSVRVVGDPESGPCRQQVQDSVGCLFSGGSVADGFGRLEKLQSNGVMKVPSSDTSRSPSPNAVSKPITPSETRPKSYPESRSRGRDQSQRMSMAWHDAAPFLLPDEGLRSENKMLKKRLAELEETLQGCLGLVDL